MAELTDAVFSHGDKLGSDELSKYVVKGVEDVHNDLVRYQEWDGKTPVATCVLAIREGSVHQCILHLEGESDPKRMDVIPVMGKDYKGSQSHQVRIGRVDLSKFSFRGNLVSDWLSPDDVDWAVTRPSNSRPGAWRDLDRPKVVEDGGLPLHFRAVAQPWTGGKLKVVMGLVPTLDIRALPGFDHPCFPFIVFATIICDYMPGQPDNFNIPLPFTPYLWNQGGEEDEEVDIPDFDAVYSACIGFFRDTSAPNVKSNLSTLTAVLKTDWRKAVVSKYIFPQIKERVPEPDQDVTGGLEGKYKSRRLNLKPK